MVRNYSKKISFEITDRQYEILKNLCEIEGRNISSYIREAIDILIEYYKRTYKSREI